jgi:sporulation protein YlmC with PRC-barrel domain
MTSAPAESWTVTNYYKQAVYDRKESKIGDIDDDLIDKSGKVTGLVIGVGASSELARRTLSCPLTG